MRKTACSNISQNNTTNQRAKTTSNALPIPKNHGSQCPRTMEAAFHYSFMPGDPPMWNLSPLSAGLPESPPPICSDCSSPPPSSATVFYSLPPTEISTSRFQSTRSNFSKPQTSSIEVEEWVQSGKNLSGFHNFTDNENMAADNYRSRKSAVDPIDPEVHRTTLSSFLIEDNTIHEKKQNHLDHPVSNHNRYSSDSESLQSGHHKLMTRPKPYNDFLDEIKARELEAQMCAWKKAKHRELMNKSRKKEAVIRDWEYKMTQKALKELKKVENKVEWERAEAQEKAQKRINKARKEANKEAGKVRDSAMKKISEIAKQSEIQGPKNPTWLKFLNLCH